MAISQAMAIAPLTRETVHMKTEIVYCLSTQDLWRADGEDLESSRSLALVGGPRPHH